MKVYDESGNFLGDFLEASNQAISGAKEAVCDMADVSLVLGIIGLICAPGITLAIICGLFIFHLFIGIIKLALKTIWWLIRLPFTLIFIQCLPKF